MRIPVASRIRLKYAVPAIVLLFVVQQMEGTDPAYSGLTALSFLLAVGAFNAAGGFTRPSGGWIFFFSLQTVLIGPVAKALLGEPGESVYVVPYSTYGVYCVTLAGLWLVARLAKTLLPVQGFLSNLGEGDEMKRAAFGSMLLALVLFPLEASPVFGAMPFITAVRQIDRFLPMSVLLATFYQVKKTGGRSSTNWIVWLAGSLSMIQGGIDFSKEGLFTAPVTWFMAAVAAGHDFSRRQIVLLAALAVFAFTFLVPFSQVGRQFRSDEPLIIRAQIAWNAALQIGELRKEFAESEAESKSDQQVNFSCFQQHEGLFDRLCIAGPDDALVNLTNDGTVEGYWPLAYAFQGIVPRFLWPDKPIIGVGNRYAHEMGGLGAEDETTGISFSPAADMYHQGGWVGVALVMPAIMLFIFLVFDAIGGDTRKSPWGLLLVVASTTNAPEGLIGGNIWLATYGAFGIVMTALLTKYVLPIASGVLMGTDRTRVRKSAVVPFTLRSADPNRTTPLVNTGNGTQS